MVDNVTPELMADQVERLAMCFGKPYGITVEKQTREWAQGFRRLGIPGVALKAAVDEATVTVKRFPTLAELIAIARNHIPPTDGARQQTVDQCPQCHGPYEWRPTDTVGQDTITCPCQYPRLLMYARTEWLEARRGERAIEAELQRRTLQHALRLDAARPVHRPPQRPDRATARDPVTDPATDRLGQAIAAKRAAPLTTTAPLATKGRSSP